MIRIFCLTVFALTWTIRVNAQNQVDWLLNQIEFKAILATHLKEIKEVEQKSALAVVSVILFRPDTERMEVYVTSVSTLVEIEMHLPSTFTTIEKHPFLIYDGSEQLIANKNEWLAKLKATVCKQLCDDSKERALMKQPGPKEIRFPCNVIYDAPIRKLTFIGVRLVKNELVGSVPYYEKLRVD